MGNFNALKRETRSEEVNEYVVMGIILLIVFIIFAYIGYRHDRNNGD
jgi:heme/copper-type cytochrome/quinol oxidase subunit 2